MSCENDIGVTVTEHEEDEEDTVPRLSRMLPTIIPTTVLFSPNNFEECAGGGGAATAAANLTAGRD
ncbi:hypothetical protein VPNG_07050 [Cytospora leucostoma]|uniref:Uncharacterized protein n=1 Tax=Cytospora leucostoma TaxID=1230097 RepID=A0A423WNP0_9PEZI|nr:hypothetical protein VPNG_07050 [Cytospora leucostoma]